MTTQPWHLGPMAPFDLESTGVDVDTARIVTATVARVGAGMETIAHTWLVAVDEDIPAEATAIHGVTTEHAREHGQPAAQVLDHISEALVTALTAGVPVVGMNVAYDFTLLDRELRRHDLPTVEDRLGHPIGPVLDVLVLDKAVDTYRRGGRKLTDLCALYNARIDGAHHSASDALAAARVAYRIAQRYPDIAAMSLAELHQAQVRWRTEQQASLADYFRARGRHEDAAGVVTDWPLIPQDQADARVL